MGKSSKKSPTATSVSEGKSGRKGKRDAEDEIEKAVSAKKQKTVPVVEPVKKQPPPKKVVQPKNVTQPKKGTKPAKEETSDDSSDESSSDDFTSNKPSAAASSSSSDETTDTDIYNSSPDEKLTTLTKKPAAVVSNGSKKVESDSSSSDSSSDEETDEDEDSFLPSNLNLEYFSCSSPTQHAFVFIISCAFLDLQGSKYTCFQGSFLDNNAKEVRTTGSKTIFVTNLSFSIEREQVKQFFEVAGEVVDVRLSTFQDGTFKGYGHVEFATAEAAQKALRFAHHDLMGRPVLVELARQSGAYTHGSGRDNSSFKSAPESGKTAYIEGFDKSIAEDQIRSALEEHFRSCGEITRVSIPKDRKTGACKGIAFIEFKGPDSLDKAYQLNASDLCGRLLFVDQAMPRPGNNRDGGFSRCGRGGSDRGRGGGRGRGFEGRGGSGDRGRGGWGTPFRQNAGTASTGKKITFADDD